MVTQHVDRPLSLVTGVVKHPLRAVAFGVGTIRGVASAVLRAASGGRGPAQAEWAAPPEPVTEEASGEPEHEENIVQLGEHTEPAEERAPGDPGEAFATEPSAVNRDSAHGGSAHVDEQIDDWYDDQDDAAGSVIEALEMGDALPDDGPNERAILSESETLRRAADPEKQN